jgi:hypothetical protein
MQKQITARTANAIDDVPDDRRKPGFSSEEGD